MPGRNTRQRLIAVVNPSCTGCEVCVDFCPVDCIDDLPSIDRVGETNPSIVIREEECIGCQVCAKVCGELTWNAIEMVPVEEVKHRSGPTARTTSRGTDSAPEKGQSGTLGH